MGEELDGDFYSCISCFWFPTKVNVNSNNGAPFKIVKGFSTCNNARDESTAYPPLALTLYRANKDSNQMLRTRSAWACSAACLELLQEKDNDFTAEDLGRYCSNSISPTNKNTDYFIIEIQKKLWHQFKMHPRYFK